MFYEYTIHKKYTYRMSYCKECDSKKAIIFRRNQRIKYPWIKTYYSILGRCGNGKSSKKLKYYGGKGIKNYLTIDNLKFLWFRDKAYLMKKPTIDRKNPNKNYILRNCRYLERNKNIARIRHPLHLSEIHKFRIKESMLSHFNNKIT